MRDRSWRRSGAMVLTLTVISCVILGTVLVPNAAAGYRGRVLRLVNATRENHGLHTVRIDASLSRKAMRHTRHMIGRDEIYDPTNLSQLMSTEPWNTVAASVAGCGGTLHGVHRAFMHHYEHRVILLNPDLRRIGVGVVKNEQPNSCGRGWFWVTELFYG